MVLPGDEEVWVVDLEQEAGVDDRLVLLVHRVRQRPQERLFIRVVLLIVEFDRIPGPAAGRNAS